MNYVATDRSAPEALAAQSASGQEPPPVTVPEKSLREMAIALAIGIVSCLYLLPFWRVTNLNPDEGLSLQGAERILHGQVPYRDFFSLVTPGAYYWTALLFKVFGDSILVARATLVIYGGVFSLLTYLLARRVCSQTNAALGAGLLTMTCLPYYFVFEHDRDSTLWALLALYCAVRFLEERGWGWAFSVGFLTSLTCLFEQSKGAGLALGLTVGFLLIENLSRQQRLFNAKRVMWLASGFALPFAVTLIYFGAKHSLGPMFADWLWPLRHYNSVNRVPYGFMHLSTSELDKLASEPLAWKVFALFTMSPCFIVAVLPILALVVLGRYVLMSRKNQLPSSGRAYYLLVCSCTTGLLLSIVDARPNLSHLMYLAPIFYVVLSWVFEAKAFGGTILPAVRSAVALYLVLSFASFGLAELVKAGAANQPLVSRRGTLETTAKDEVVAYVQNHVPAGANLFVYPYQPLYYYLTETRNPTSFDFLYYGYQTPGQFREVAQQLKSNLPKVLLFCPSFLLEIGLNAFPQTPLKVIAQRDPMIDLIVSHYRTCTVLRSTQSLNYIFMMRRDLPCPR